MSKEDISPRMRRMLEKGRQEARKRVIERGIVQFRADEQMMQELLQLSEFSRVPLGTMIRNWVAERIEIERTQKGVSNIDALVEKIASAVVKKLHAKPPAPNS